VSTLYLIITTIQSITPKTHFLPIIKLTCISKTYTELQKTIDLEESQSPLLHFTDSLTLSQWWSTCIKLSRVAHCWNTSSVMSWPLKTHQHITFTWIVV